MIVGEYIKMLDIYSLSSLIIYLYIVFDDHDSV